MEARGNGPYAGDDGAPLPILMYKEGEPLPALEQYYRPDSASPQVVEVRIPAHCLTSANRQVRARQLWGSDVYTSDSDVVAALMHCGHWSPSAAHAPAGVAEVRARLLLRGPQDSYCSTNRNAVRSRAWAARTADCAYEVASACALTRAGLIVELEPNPAGIPSAVPTFVPGAAERIVTRASAGAGARSRATQEATVMFNLLQEPWVKYSLPAIADRGLRPHERTSARLLDAALYWESAAQRYELVREDGGGGGGHGEAPAATEGDTYALSRCSVLLDGRDLARAAPLAPALRAELHRGVVWEEIQWGAHGATVRGEFFPILRFHFQALAAAEAAA